MLIQWAAVDSEPATGNVHSSASSFTEHRQNERQSLLSSSQNTTTGSDKGLIYRTFPARDGSMQSGSGTSTPRENSGATATKTIKRKIKNVNYWTYYIPILSWLPDYSLRLLPGDIAAGLTVSVPMVANRLDLHADEWHILADNMPIGPAVDELCFRTRPSQSSQWYVPSASSLSNDTRN